MKHEGQSTKKEELSTFLGLTVIAAPLLSVITVGAYGFAIWMIQLLTGSLPTH